MAPTSRAAPARAQRPTLEEVASLAGVSRATVSRVVNDSPRVSAELRDRVESAIRDLGYLPNLAARTLVTQRTMAVAVVMGESATRVFTDPFFGGIVRAATRELGRRGLQTIMLMVHDEQDRARVERYLAAGHVDGAVMFSLHRDDPLPLLTARIGLPTVLGGRPWTDADEADEAGSTYSVDVDNTGGARLAVEHLLGQGRRRIATITGPLDITAGLDRLDGYRAALRAAGLADDELVVGGAFTQAGGEAAVVELLARDPTLDAVFAASDQMAAGAIRALRRQGRTVPDDVAVVGFDDHLEIARWTEPPLTTVHQPIDEMGTKMVQLLTARIDGDESPRRVVLPTHLVRRESA